MGKSGGKWGKWQNRGFGGIPKNGEIGEIAYFGGIWGKCPNSQNRGRNLSKWENYDFTQKRLYLSTKS